MKRIFGTAIAMALSVMLACGALGFGFYHLEVARAEEALATFDAARVDLIYARLEKTLEIVRHIPWVFKGLQVDLQVRKSRLSYLRQDYAAILKEAVTTREDEKTLSPSLRFIRANARFRAIPGEQGREQVIRDLGQCIRDYAKAIETDPTFTDAAFNYEFLLLLRDDIAGGKRPFRRQGAQKSSNWMKEIHGMPGDEPGDEAPQQMKVMVPKESDEDPTERNPEPGKGTAPKKNG
jgi:hypothetical protein